jgi:ABC-type Mn2+/Zn2+ transport system permease subunit
MAMLELVYLSSAIGGLLLALVGYYISRLHLSTIAFSAAHAALAGAAISAILGSDPYVIPATLTLCLGLVLGMALPKANAEVMNNLSMMMFSMFNSVALIGIYLSNTVVLSTTRVGGLLWGSPLAITADRFIGITVLTGAFLIYLMLFKPKLDAVVFDKKLAESEGINVQAHSIAIITFTCIALVLMLEMVGGFLVFSLIYVPCIVSVVATSRADLQLVISGLFGAIVTPLGAYFSLLLDTPIGSTIALTISLLAIAIYLAKRIAKTITRPPLRASSARSATL